MAKISDGAIKAYKAAVKARALAYAPYSKFKVGAALMTKDGKVFSGCNVENASYGATICAERTAILKAVSEEKKKFAEMVIVTDLDVPANPCGQCLQVISEFCPANFKIHLANLDGIQFSAKLSDFLPRQFDKSVL